MPRVLAKSKPTPNFSALWERLRSLAEIHNDDGMKAALLNHERRKEYICRKFGVVTDADVNRVAGDLAKVSKVQK